MPPVPAGRPRRARRRIAVALVLVLVAGAVTGYLLTRPRAADVALYTEGVALSSSGDVVAVETGTSPAVHEGTQVLDDPDSGQDQVLAQDQRDWLAAGDLPGGEDGPYADMVRRALLDIRTLLLDDGAAVAAWSPGWRYVWPRDASFVAVALARTDHREDALAVLDFLAGVQEEDGSFQARYLPDGSGPPDERGTQSDGDGWVLWAASEVVAASPEAERSEVAEQLRPLVERSVAYIVDLVGADGTPPPSPDYWEVSETELTLGTIAPLLAGLRHGAQVLTVLGDQDGAEAASDTADTMQAALLADFGTYFGRYPEQDAPDAASTFTLEPFQPEALPGALTAWQASVESMSRPAGGLAPGSRWRDDGISWTPQTSLYAFAAASNGQDEDARGWLDWLDAHRTGTGALPEKVLADGSPAAVAPLAWTAACVLLAVDELDG